MNAPTSVVGQPLPRLEARAKVTGRAEYVHNMRVPNMLYAKVFRSTLAHGRIRSIDVSAACAMPGVFAVYTGEDIRKLIAEPYYGPAFHDQPILAIDKVRYVGEPVAVVLAADVHVAENAAALITAQYDELPAVYGEVEAMNSRAVVHEVLKPAGTFADLKYLKDKRDTNIALDFHLLQKKWEGSRVAKGVRLPGGIRDKLGAEGLGNPLLAQLQVAHLNGRRHQAGLWLGKAGPGKGELTILHQSF